MYILRRESGGPVSGPSVMYRQYPTVSLLLCGISRQTTKMCQHFAVRQFWVEGNVRQPYYPSPQCQDSVDFRQGHPAPLWRSA